MGKNSSKSAAEALDEFPAPAEKAAPVKAFDFFSPPEGKPFMVYQLGTNNWQREGEFSPGSGILHEAHHNALSEMDGVVNYSMYPSEHQSPHPDPTVEVFKLSHPIPICESVSPVSSYRWHSMSEEEFESYLQRLEDAVYNQMEKAEEREGSNFSLCIAHHTFANPLVMRRVLLRRKEAGKPPAALACFVHGTALKMYVHERNQKLPEEYPLRFLPMMEKSGVFNPDDNCSVQICYAISQQQIEAFVDIFGDFPSERIITSPNGVNQKVFHAQEGCTIANTLVNYPSWHFEGSSRESETIKADQYDRVIVLVGKFAEWKRIPALLYAASEYESKFDGKVATVIVGTGPHDAQVELQTLAYDTLKLEHTYFLGPQGQPDLAKLYTIASVGVFPSWKEPFGLVIVECMSCGTPVIGANSGGPRDFVDDKVGKLVEETDDIKELGSRVSEAIQEAINEDWKSSKSENCVNLAKERFSVTKQCKELVCGTREVLGF